MAESVSRYHRHSKNWNRIARKKTVLIIGLHNWFATLLSHLAKASGTQGTVLDDSSRALLNLKKNDNVENGETP